MKILKTVFVGMVVLAMATAPAYGARKKDKDNNGKAKGHDKQNQSNNGNQSSNANAPEKRNHVTEKGRTQADVRANIPDHAGGNNSTVRANLTRKTERGRSADRSGKKEDKVKGFLNALNHARWSHNPHDERGQGNMGKPKMRDPYGFDKDSNREKSERGRPIHPTLPTLNLEEMISIYGFSYYEWMAAKYAGYAERYADLAEQYPSNADYYNRLAESYSNTSKRYATLAETYANQYEYYAVRYAEYAQRYADYAERYPSNADYYTRLSQRYSDYSTYYARLAETYTWQQRVAVNLGQTIDYNIGFTVPEGYEGTTLQVTTTLTSVNDYDYTSYRWSYDSTTGTWQRVAYNTLHYDAGEAVVTQTQEVTLNGSEETFTFSYDPPDNLAGTTLQLNFTVTEPESGTTYTYNASNQYSLYRCPYGKVYNAKTHEAIVGAKVTVHFEDGSIVPLDKASNPTAKNPQKTDATGRYGVKLQTNRKYYLTAKAEGYEDYKSEIFTEKWHVLREDISLTPLEAVASK